MKPLLKLPLFLHSAATALLFLASPASAAVVMDWQFNVSSNVTITNPTSLSADTVATGLSSVSLVVNNTGTIVASTGTMNLTRSGNLGWGTTGGVAGTSADDKKLVFNFTVNSGFQLTLDGFASAQVGGANTLAEAPALDGGTPTILSGIQPGSANGGQLTLAATQAKAYTFTTSLSDATITPLVFSAGTYAIYFDLNSNSITSTSLVDYITFNGSLAAVPEPATWALLASGLTVVTVLRRRRMQGN